MYTVGQIAEKIGAEVVGDPTTEILGVGSIQNAVEGDIAHLSSAQYRPFLETTGASAVILQVVSCGESLCCLCYRFAVV